MDIVSETLNRRNCFRMIKHCGKSSRIQFFLFMYRRVLTFLTLIDIRQRLLVIYRTPSTWKRESAWCSIPTWICESTGGVTLGTVNNNISCRQGLEYIIIKNTREEEMNGYQVSIEYISIVDILIQFFRIWIYSVNYISVVYRRFCNYYLNQREILL